MLNIKKHLRTSALLEGTSFLLLLFIAMPVKYLAGIPQPVTYIGWAHGILFVWYIIAVLFGRTAYNFNIKQTAIALAASILPFGTFYADKTIYKQL